MGLLEKTWRRLKAGRYQLGRSQHRKHLPLRLEVLEDRLALAFNLTIGAGSAPSTGVIITQDETSTIFVAQAEESFLNIVDLEPALAHGDVTLRSSTTPDSPGDLTIAEGVNIQGSIGTLFLEAGGRISLNSGGRIQTTSQLLTMSAIGGISIDAGATVASTDGTISIQGQLFGRFGLGGLLQTDQGEIQISAHTFSIAGMIQAPEPVQIISTGASTFNEINYREGASLPGGLAITMSSSGHLALFDETNQSSRSHTYDIAYSSIIRDGAPALTFVGGLVVDIFGGALADTFNVTSGIGPHLGVTGGGGEDVLNIQESGPIGTLPRGGVGLVNSEFVFANGGRLTPRNIPVTNLIRPTGVNAGSGPNFVDRSTAFFGLNPQQRFVQALYLDALGRIGGLSELDGWALAFNSGSAEQAQFQIALGVEHSPEARTRLARSWYQSYLHRAAGPGEEQYWVSQLLKGSAEEVVLSEFLSSQEFYDKAQTQFVGTSDQQFVIALYRQLLLRDDPSPNLLLEVNPWVSQIGIIGRQGIVRGILGTEAFRSNQFAGYYLALLHRPADTAGLAMWISTTRDLESVRIGFESSSEFFNLG
jgi:hypothetical protein